MKTGVFENAIKLTKKTGLKEVQNYSQIGELVRL